MRMNAACSGEIASLKGHRSTESIKMQSGKSKVALGSRLVLTLLTHCNVSVEYFSIFVCLLAKCCMSNIYDHFSGRERPK